MNNCRVALALSVAYWIGAIAFGFMGAPLDGGTFGEWYGLYFLGGCLFFAIPLTIAVWAIGTLTKAFGIGLRPVPFVILGIVLAGLDIWGFISYKHWGPLHEAQESKERFLSTKLDWIRDEPLMTPNGPIGVRIEYRVTYGVPEPVCELQIQAGYLTLGRPLSRFDRTASLVSPNISGACPAGSYEFTADFMPVFIPRFLANSSMVANPKSRCMRWRADLPSKEVVLSTKAQRLDFSMIFRGTEFRQSTQNTYTLADFYKTALAAGGIDCAENTQ